MNSFRPFFEDSQSESSNRGCDFDDESKNEEYKNDISYSLSSINKDVEECIKETENALKKLDTPYINFTAEDIRKRSIDIHYENIKSIIYQNAEKFSIEYTVSSTIAKEITKKLVEDKFRVEKTANNDNTTVLCISW